MKFFSIACVLLFASTFLASCSHTPDQPPPCHNTAGIAGADAAAAILFVIENYEFLGGGPVGQGVVVVGAATAAAMGSAHEAQVKLAPGSPCSNRGHRTSLPVQYQIEANKWEDLGNIHNESLDWIKGLGELNNVVFMANSYNNNFYSHMLERGFNGSSISMSISESTMTLKDKEFLEYINNIFAVQNNENDLIYT